MKPKLQGGLSQNNLSQRTALASQKLNGLVVNLDGQTGVGKIT